MKEQRIKPMACIVGEPTMMVPAIAHKGVYRYRCCVRGKEAHSSLTPQSVNAIEMASRVVGRLRDMAEGFERTEPRDAEFRYEFRDLPTADARGMQAQLVDYARSLEPAMQKVAPGTGFSFDTI